MRLIVGLGNPGPGYAGNRHNVGFEVVREIKRRHEMGAWQRLFQGVSAKGLLDGERVALLLPGTFMNESGRAVRAAACRRASRRPVPPAACGTAAHPQ